MRPTRRLLLLTFSALLPPAAWLLLTPGGPLRADASPPDRHPIHPVHISGSFAEYRRGGRYHLALDYKTFNRLRLPVSLPFDDGAVIRLFVQEGGYGNALIMASSGGTLTFAHLNDFRGVNADLENLRLALELLHPTHNAAVFVPGWFRFQRGQLIARTGESGIGPPHLHFEIIKNGYFQDPLTVPGFEINDRTSPVIQAVYVKSGETTVRIPCVSTGKKETVNGKDSLKYEAELAPEVDADKIRFMIGAHDTMAALNVNAVSWVRLSLEPGASGSVKGSAGSAPPPLFEKHMDKILTGEIFNADSVYDGTRTYVGREYVYLLGQDQAIPESGLFRLEVGDATGNQSHVVVKLTRSKSAKTSKVTPESAGFTRVIAGRSSPVHAASGRSDLTLFFQPGSILEPGYVKVRPLAEAEFVREQSEITRVPAPSASSQGRAEGDWVTENGKYALAGPGFLISNRDLFYRDGTEARITYPDTGDKRVALYVMHKSTGQWIRLAYPSARGGGVVSYQFKLRFEGLVAQLADITPPAFAHIVLWDRPLARTEEGRDYFREYGVRESGSGIDPRGSVVLLDGERIPSHWEEDNNVLRVTVPEELVGPRGALLSLRLKDKAGNESDWMFDYIVPSSHEK
ncbi:MAG: M23 family metallopeptidase [Spirochaetia bacterium]|nr:M23 family metallopeptidase [Spirochaetia bacterium]